MRGAKPSLNTGDAREILKAVERGNKLKEKDIPGLKKLSKSSYKCDKCADDETDAKVELMSAVVHHRAKENNISPNTLSSNADITKIAYGIKSGVPTLSG